MNAPDRMDAVRVPEGMPKISLTPDEKVTNAATFKIAREDHTLGNLLRMELLRDSARVKFAGYKHPHPLENDILIRVQATIGTTPVQVISDAARRLEDEFRTLQSQFQRQVAEIQQRAEGLE